MKKEEVKVYEKEMPKAFIQAYKKNNKKPPKYIYYVLGGLAKYGQKPKHSTLFIELAYRGEDTRFFSTLKEAKKKAAKISGPRKKAWIVKYIYK